MMRLEGQRQVTALPIDELLDRLRRGRRVVVVSGVAEHRAAFQAVRAAVLVDPILWEETTSRATNGAESVFSARSYGRIDFMAANLHPGLPVYDALYLVGLELSPVLFNQLGQLLAIAGDLEVVECTVLAEA